jgi:E3 ubiquitin-protein ligase SIAH1
LFWQCHNGHTLCSTCKTRVHNRCPTCRQELGDIRCLALEKVAESLELRCKYSSLGCREIFPYYSKLKHEAVCNFRPYNCPYAGSDCSIVGDIPFLVAHLRDDHKVDMHSGCTFNHRYVKSNPREVENATWMLTVSIKCLFFLCGISLTEKSLQDMFCFTEECYLSFFALHPKDSCS